MHGLIDKDGKKHGPFPTGHYAAWWAGIHLGKKQDCNHPGEGYAANGWDLIAVRADG